MSELPFKRYVVRVSTENVPSIREITIVKLTPTGIWKRDDGELVRNRWAWQETESEAWGVFCKENLTVLTRFKESVERLEAVLALAYEAREMKQ